MPTDSLRIWQPNTGFKATTATPLQRSPSCIHVAMSLPAHFLHLRTALVQDSSFSTCLLNQPRSEPFRLADEGRVPHIVFDNIVNLVFPTGLCCVDEVLSGGYGAGFVVHAQNVSCGDDTPGRISSHVPVVFISYLFLHGSCQVECMVNLRLHRCFQRAQDTRHRILFPKGK